MKWIYKPVRKAPSWSVVYVYGHCPNTFDAPPPSLAKGRRGTVFWNPIFSFLKDPTPWGLWKDTLACLFWVELKSAQTIMASLLTPLKPENAHLDMDQKVPKTIRTSVYTPFLSGNAYIQGPHFKKRFPDLALGSHPRPILQFFNLFFQKAVAPTRLPFGLNI